MSSLWVFSSISSFIHMVIRFGWPREITFVQLRKGHVFMGSSMRSHNGGSRTRRDVSYGNCVIKTPWRRFVARPPAFKQITTSKTLFTRQPSADRPPIEVVLHIAGYVMPSNGKSAPVGLTGYSHWIPEPVHWICGNDVHKLFLFFYYTV